MSAWIGVGIAGATAALALAGWLANIPALERTALDGGTMTANTALLILLVCVGLVALRSAPGVRYARATGRVFGLAVLTLAGLTLVEQVFGINMGIDQVLAHDPTGGADPGRIPVQAAFTLIALGIALLLLEPGDGRRASLPGMLALVGCVPPALGVMGYISGTQTLYHLPHQAQIAPATAVALLLLSWAVLAVRVTEGGLRLASLDSAGGRLARRLIPATIGVPVGLGLLRRLGEAQGVFTSQVGLWLMICAGVVLLSGVAWRAAEQLDLVDTARRSAEDALRAQRDGFAAVITAQHDGVSVVSAVGVLTEANPALCRMTGFSREELLGSCEPLPFVRAEDQAKINAYNRGQETGDAAAERDLMLRHKDGSEVPVIFASAPLRDEDGLVTATVTTVKDVSERHRAEEQRHRYDERFAALLETAADAVVIADPAGRIYLVNTEAERLFGYRREELLGQSVELLLPERVRAAHVRHRDNYNANPHRRGPKNLSGRRQDGTEFPIAVSLSTLDTDDGRLVTAFVRDTTTFQRQQDERDRLHAELDLRADDLARSNAELEQFAYIASHDLAEPLRTISGFTQLLARRYEGQLDDDADRFIGFVVDGVTRMQMLITDLLAYSRAARAELEVQPVSLTDVVTKLLASLASAIEDAGAEITVGVLPTVDADETQLGQVLQNLVCNALKFHQPGCPPRLQISAAKTESAWRISVTDNGLGIEPAHSDRIFKMFQRLHGREDYPGTGVGLAVCQRLVERHHGRIWFEPNESQGTIFNFTLPIAAAPRDDDATRPLAA